MKSPSSFIDLTPRAATQILGQLPRNEEGVALRFAARRLEDGSFHYGMGFDDGRREGDQTFTVRKVPVVIAADSLALVRGMTVDFVELEPGRRDFIFLNPNDPAYVPPTEQE